MIYTISYIMAAKTHCGGRSELRRCAFLSTGNWPRMSWRGEEGAGDTVEGRRDGGERKVRVEWRGIEGRQQQEAMAKRDCGDEAVTRRAGRENEMWVWTFCHAMRVRDWTVLFIVRWEEKELPFAFFCGKSDCLLWEKYHIPFYTVKNNTYPSQSFLENNYQVSSLLKFGCDLLY